MWSTFLTLVLTLFFCVEVGAQEISAQSFFNRCYTQLTGKPVPLGHALMAQVKAGKVTPIAACKQILHKGMLSSNGQLATKTDVEGIAVLNTFYNFHRGWFPSNNLDSISGYSSGEQNGTVDVYDTTEPALAITYSVFGAGQKYSDTLTRSTGVHAYRSESAATKARLGWKSSTPGRFISNTVEMEAAPFTFRATGVATTVVSRNINKHISTIKAMPKIEIGELIGIRATTEGYNVPNISLLPQGNSTLDKGSLKPELNYSYDFYKTYGGGVLGTPIYLLQNLGHGYNTTFNGQTKVARRWSQVNMNTFLCASLPALRESDVTQYLNTSSSAAFRNSNSCLMCHATLDPMAYSARNLVTGATDIFRPTKNGDDTRDANGTLILAPAAYYKTAVAITSYKASMGSVSGWPAEPVTNFHQQTPTGRLYFRSFTGSLVDKSFTGISGLGAAMVQTDDYYMCAAKRYFEFMTGISVALYDRTDPRNVETNKSQTEQDIEDLAYITKLSQNLRSSGSVVQMIQDIMESDYYSKENYR
jgi:hypothetical protein